MSKDFRISTATLASALAVGFGGGHVARAQEPAASASIPKEAPPAPEATSGLEDIIVTAQKRSERLQRVPIAVTALSGSTLAARGATDFSSVAQAVPNATFNTTVGETRIGIRGITFDNIFGTGAEARVPFHLDGVYLSRTGNIGGTFFDIDRIEVLRGPQGTLFGRNAVAGAVNLITKDPTPSFEGYARLDVGNYNTVIAEGALSGPLTDSISVRIAGRATEHDGYGHDLTTGRDIDDQHERDVRAKIKLDPGNGLTAVLSADYSRESENSGLYFIQYLYPNTSLPGNPRTNNPQNPRDIYEDTTPSTYKRYYGFGANINYELTPSLSFTSITGYRRSRERFVTDFDMSEAAYLSPGLTGANAHQFSEEARFSKEFGRGNITVGGYYFDERYAGGVSVRANLILFGSPVSYQSQGINNGAAQKTTAYAFFANANYEIVDGLKLTAGARYSYDKKREYNAYNVFDTSPFNGTLCPQPCSIASLPAGTPLISGQKSWSNVSPTVSLRYQIDPDKSVYATFSEGFKGGGYNLGFDLSGKPFNPETLRNYEIGFKGDFLDRRLRANLAGFYYDYKNLQVFKTLGQQVGAVILNAASATLYGAEAEIEFLPVDGLRLNLSGSLTKSKFTNFQTLDPARPQGPNGDPNQPFDLSGNRLPNAPTYTANYGVEYTSNVSIGKLTVRGEGYSVSKLYFDGFNVDRFSSKPYTMLNAFVNLALHDGKYVIGFYGKNLTNVLRINGGTLSNGFTNFAIQSQYLPPRTYGVHMEAHF